MAINILWYTAYVISIDQKFMEKRITEAKSNCYILDF